MTVGFDIPEELEQEWRDLLASDREQGEALYFARILPSLLEHLESLDHHRALRDRGYETLVSLMGFSPETTIISTSVLRPQRLVVLASRNTMRSYDRAHAVLLERGVLAPSSMFLVPIDPTDHTDIYAKMREHLDDGGRHIVDVTGGKKVMSATAAQGAWEMNLPLCYVESPRYDPQLRRPVPGFEELIVLPNPSEERARMLRNRALDTYASKLFAAARDAFRTSQHVQADNSLDELGLALSDCYIAWADLDRNSLELKCRALRAIIAQPRIARLLPPRLDLDSHIGALEAVASGESLALIATFLELADLYADQGRADFACLLAYRAMEALVALGFSMATEGRFKMHDPDYSLLGDVDRIRSDYVALSGGLHRRPDSDLPGRLTFVAGFALLCLTQQLHERMPVNKGMNKCVAHMAGMSERRNRSILAHGTHSLGSADCATLQHTARSLAMGVLGERVGELDELRTRLHPRPLDAVGVRRA